MQLVGNVRVQATPVARKTSWQLEAMENRLHNVGNHFPMKGKGKDHRCIVCKRKRDQWIKSNSDCNPKDCPFLFHCQKQHFVAVDVNPRTLFTLKALLSPPLY